jgi:hypothetical protein
MAWDVAKSLDKLLSQINELAPHRSKASDGSIGDTAHQAGASDHNPENKPGLEPDEVDARDFTHDPAHGCDIGQIFEAIRLSCKAGRERRVKYLIFNRRYCSRNTGWAWWPYTGDSPHDHHGHVSVNDVDDDNTSPWEITTGRPVAAVEEWFDMRGILGNLAGRSTVWYGVKGVTFLESISSEASVEALTAAGAVRRTFTSAGALVESCGRLAGDTTGSASLDAVAKAG